MHSDKPEDYRSNPSKTPTGIKGAGQDAPLAECGRQSKVEGRYDLLPPLALAAIAVVMEPAAAKYGEHSWKKIEPESHINHSLMHIVAFLAGDDSELNGDVVEHLRHALTRMAFAVDQYDSGRFKHPSQAVKTDTYGKAPYEHILGDILAQTELQKDLGMVDANATTGIMHTGDPVEDATTYIMNTFHLTFHGHGDKDHVAYVDVRDTISRALYPRKSR